MKVDLVAFAGRRECLQSVELAQRKVEHTLALLDATYQLLLIGDRDSADHEAGKQLHVELKRAELG